MHCMHCMPAQCAHSGPLSLSSACMPFLTRQPASSHPLFPSGRHSLGGALATLAAYEAVHLCKRLEGCAGFPGASIQVYTYGAPRPGALACSMRGVQLSSSRLGSFKTAPLVKIT